MAAPTFIASGATVFNTNTTPKTTANITTQASDVICVVGGTGDQATTLGTPTGNSLTYSLQQSVVVASYCTAYGWTTTDGTGATFGVSNTRAGNADLWGIHAIQFRGSTGVGASAKTNVSSGAPSLSITTTQDNSAIVIACLDWSATDGASRTWRSVNGSAATELTYFRDSSIYTVYIGYHPDAGTAGSKTVGLSAPAGQKYAIVAVEIKGTAGGGSNFSFPFRRNPSRGLIMRGRR